MTHRDAVFVVQLAEPVIERRALAIWPRLDRRALHRCGGDPRRIARLVSHRTSLSIDVIVGMLTRPPVTSQELESWFG
jgi:hypothetical protein